MSLLYRMGTGNGSGGDLKPYIVQFTCDSGYRGQTLTMTYKGTPHAGETVDNVSGTVASDGTLTLYPMHSGEWECSCYSSVIGTTMKKTIDLSYWGTTNVSFEDTPNGATVTPTDDVQTWLHCANIWDKSYTTISEVVADTTTLNTLIANENANDYLVRSTTFATDICSNESAMTYIGLNDYCANKLLADSTWLEAICNTEETLLKKVLNVYVPTLTSNTGSDGGEVKYSSYYDNDRLPYMAFDGKDSSWCSNSQNAGEWIQYNFKRPVKVSYMTLEEDNLRFSKMKISGSDNGVDFTDIITITATSKDVKQSFINDKPYSIYRLTSLTSGNFMAIRRLQFYGREEA